jgi:hypothetical protein
MPTIRDLREIAMLSQASFLTGGIPKTLYPLSQGQAEELFQIVAAGNPEVRVIWPDIQPSQFVGPVPDLDAEYESLEGRPVFRWHISKERDRILVENKKQSVLEQGGSLECEVCGFSFAETYGERGEDFCEVHHRNPLREYGAASLLG